MSLVAFLQEEKKQASDRLRAGAEPSKKDENFRFSLPLALNEEDTRLWSAAPGFWEYRENEEAALFLLHKGQQEIFLKAESLIFSPWNALSEPEATRVEECLKRFAGLGEDTVVNQALAHAKFGYVLVIPQGVKLELPVRFAAWLGASANVRNLVLLERGASLRLVEEWGSDGSQVDIVANSLTDFYLGPEAHLEFSFVQAMANNARFFMRQRFILDKSAHLEMNSSIVGGQFGQIGTFQFLAGKEASIQSHGAVKLAGRQSVDIWNELHHVAAETKSSLHYFYVVNEESRAVFNGKIVIPKQSPGCNAEQKNRSLLLSPKATIHTMPKLEIFTDEVKCAHGASVSSVQEDQLYYLQTRGVSKEQAEAMIVAAFTEPVFDRVPIESVRDRIRGKSQTSTFLQ